MSKPNLIVVEDDQVVRQQLEQDLQREYGERYSILGVGSAGEALEKLRHWKSENEPVALLIVEHRMKEMPGIEFIKQTIDIFPDAKRVLLSSHEDTDIAIKALKTVRLDHFLLRPWQPAEQNLYPVLNDLLSDWEINALPPFEGVRVIGYRFSPESHETRDFLVRNCIPFKWLDIERDDEAKRLLTVTGVKSSDLPIVIFPDGTKLVRPSNTDIAEKVGLKIHPKDKFYDLVIVGGGPTGLAAAVYGASEGLRTVIVEAKAPGGQAGLSTMIENYLGFPAGLSGSDLARRAVAQAKKFEVEILTPQVVNSLRLEGSSRVVTLGDGTELHSHVVLLATGITWRKLDVPGIDKLTGAGVYYGGTLAEAFFCRNEDIYIVGGGNSAGQAALFFSHLARTVTLLVRGDSLSKTMSQYLIDQISATENIKVRLQTRVVEAHGDKRLEAITVVDDSIGKKETLPTNSLFIFIGGSANTEWLDGVVEKDDKGFIMTGNDLVKDDGKNSHGHSPAGWSLDRDPLWLESSVPGVFAAGDVRHGSVKRVAAGVGEGATAVQFIHRYLNPNFTN